MQFLPAYIQESIRLLGLYQVVIVYEIIVHRLHHLEAEASLPTLFLLLMQHKRGFAPQNLVRNSLADYVCKSVQAWFAHQLRPEVVTDCPQSGRA